MLKIHCQEPWFSKIKSGIKKIEGRKYSDKYASLQSGEVVMFYCNDDSFLVEIVKVVAYPTVEEYIKTEGVSRVLPGIASFNDALNVYLGFNSKEQIQKSGGFLAIHVRVKESSL